MLIIVLGLIFVAIILLICTFIAFENQVTELILKIKANNLMLAELLERKSQEYARLKTKYEKSFDNVE